MRVVTASAPGLTGTKSRITVTSLHSPAEGLGKAGGTLSSHVSEAVSRIPSRACQLSENVAASGLTGS